MKLSRPCAHADHQRLLRGGERRRSRARQRSRRARQRRRRRARTDGRAHLVSRRARAKALAWGRYSSRTEFMISWNTRLPAASTRAAMNAQSASSAERVLAGERDRVSQLEQPRGLLVGAALGGQPRGLDQQQSPRPEQVAHDRVSSALPRIDERLEPAGAPPVEHARRLAVADLDEAQLLESASGPRGRTPCSPRGRRRAPAATAASHRADSGQSRIASRSCAKTWSGTEARGIGGRHSEDRPPSVPVFRTLTTIAIQQMQSDTHTHASTNNNRQTARYVVEISTRRKRQRAPSQCPHAYTARAQRTSPTEADRAANGRNNRPRRRQRRSSRRWSCSARWQRRLNSPGSPSTATKIPGAVRRFWRESRPSRSRMFPTPG